MKDYYCVKLLVLWGCPLDLYEMRWWDGLRDTRLEHAMVLVNSEIRTKISFLQNSVNGIHRTWLCRVSWPGLMPRSWYLHFRKAQSFFHVTPAFSSRRKWSHEFGPDKNLTSQVIDIWFGASFKKRTALKVCIKIHFQGLPWRSSG